MAKEERSTFWDRIFGLDHRSEREERVLDYVVHRIGYGARLEEVLEEEYVRRYACHDEVEDILDDPRLVRLARKKMEENLEKLGQTIRARRR